MISFIKEKDYVPQLYFDKSWEELFRLNPERMEKLLKDMGM